MQDFGSKSDRLELFLAKLTNGRQPVEYYAQHIKNLAMSRRFFSENKVMKRILDICTGVENLALFELYASDFFENPQAGRSLRRLTVNLGNFSFGSMPNFYHPCFASLTHLHLYGEDWSNYAGWEALVSLTHLAFAHASASPSETQRVMQMLPAIRYVAFGFYKSSPRTRYAEVVVYNVPHITAAWGVRVVFLSEIPQHDWEWGAQGEGDFWDVVEQEVERRLEEGLVD